jgi:hypothetical protein
MVSRDLRSIVGTDLVHRLNQSKSQSGNISRNKAKVNILANSTNPLKSMLSGNWRKLAIALCYLPIFGTVSEALIPKAQASVFSSPAAADAKPSKPDLEALCGKPSLDLLVEHEVVKGDTLVAIAQKYQVTTATIMGFNPAVRSGRVSVRTKAFDSAHRWYCIHMGNEDNYRIVAREIWAESRCIV